MKNKTLNLTLTSIMTALICVLSFITIPNPFGAVPFTLQTFAVSFAGFWLGAKYGTLSVGAYIVIGLIGLPVFSGFQGGIGVLFGPTGGFIFGFLVFSFLCGIAQNRDILFALLLSFLGLLICHTLGMAFYCIYSKSSFLSAFLWVSAPFILKDIVSVLASFFVAKTVRRKINTHKM